MRLTKQDETRGIGEKMAPYGMYLLIRSAPSEEVRHFIEGFR